MAIDYKEDILFKIPIIGAITKWLANEDSDYGTLVFSLCVAIFAGMAYFTQLSFGQIFIITALLAPVWLTYLIFRHLFFNMWLQYVGTKFNLNNGRSTLRIKLPPQVEKSPEAMEFVLTQMWNNYNSDNLMQTYLDGKKPLYFSYEIVSIGGDVRFYMNVPTKKIKALVEAALYSQYPGVEVIEEPVDYIAEIPLKGSDWSLMSFHMGKKKDQEFPIKTYIDYGLDKMPKEEEKVDPLTPMLETMGSIGPDERLYMQLIMSVPRDNKFKNGSLDPEEPSFDAKVAKKVNEIMNRDPETGKPIPSPDGEREEIARLTAGEREKVEAMERNGGKYAYKTGIRWMYLAKGRAFNADNIGKMIRAFSQFDKKGRNEVGIRWRTDANYQTIFPWDAKKVAAWKKAELKEYKKRVYYNKAGGDAPKFYTTEELATMYHLPGKVAITPNLGRIESTRSTAPANLPIGNLPT
jgi:hypothetical protein